MFLSLKHTVGFFLIVTLCSASPEEYSLPSLLFTAPFEPSWPSYYTSVALAMQDINNNSTILPNTKLVLDIHSYGRKQADAIAKMIEFSDKNQTLVVGHLLSFGSVVTGIVGNVYGVAQLAVSSTSTELSDKLRYPYFSRVAPPSSGQVRSIVETVRYYAEMQGPGWDEIGIISTTDPYGVDSSETLIELAKDTRHISVQVYQQFLPDATDFDLELSETAKAGVRVIVALIISVWEEFIVAADAMGLVGDHYVWIVPDSISCCVFEDETVNRLTQGTLGVFQYIPSPEESTKVADFYERWLSLDPSIYLGTTEPPSKFTILAYDMAMVAGVVLDHLDQMGELETPRISAERMTEVIRMASFDGLSGLVTFDEEGDRISDYSVSYYSAEERRWIVAAIYSELTGSYSPVRDVVWFSNTTEVPDLDIRDPFNYWSCHDKEKKTDETGKIIQRQTPGSEDINNIDSDYYCDKFIDCWNLSDESSGCSSNYVALYIAFGIITGILLLISLMFLILVILFGLILKYRRLRAFSPLFMLIVILSIILGYLSVFAWFGKPHPVACAFQPWLLGISSVSMIAALCAKTFRIWRIFRRRMSKQKISDLELLALWILAMLPVILILTVWAIVSTPTASLEKRDGKEHYICTTGGFTGEPGGLIFFIILIVYAAIVLSIGVFLSIVTRSVPSRFNESKLLAISIYNLGFLSIVVIPVFMVIQPFDPFIAWILRTCAILYAFTAVLVLQCVPPFVAILVFDRCSNVRVFKSSLKFNNSNSPMTNSSPSAIDTSN